MKRNTALSMIDEANVKVFSGLRPKIRIGKKNEYSADSKSLVSNQNRADGSSSNGSSSMLCSNPLERLCELLLDWRILDDISSGRNTRTDNNTGSTFNLLPNSFLTCQEYVTAWEPLLIEEIKANVVSNSSLNKRNQPKYGTVTVSEQGLGTTRQQKPISNKQISDSSMSIINLNCNFTSKSTSSSR